MYFIWHLADIHSFILILIHAHQVLMNLVRPLYMIEFNVAIFAGHVLFWNALPRSGR